MRRDNHRSCLTLSRDTFRECEVILKQSPKRVGDSFETSIMNHPKLAYISAQRSNRLGLLRDIMTQHHTTFSYPDSTRDQTEARHHPPSVLAHEIGS